MTPHNENYSTQRLVQSTPGSPQEHGRPNSFEVVGSAESLVGRVSVLIMNCPLSYHFLKLNVTYQTYKIGAC